MQVYCDSNLYMDFLLDRKSPTGEPLGLCAQWVFTYARNCSFHIVISDHVVSEVKRNLPSDKHEYFDLLLDKLKPKLVWVHVTNEDRTCAHQIDVYDNFPDALHVCIAVRAGADALVTNNYADFVPYLPYLRSTRLIRPVNIATLLPNP